MYILLLFYVTFNRYLFNVTFSESLSGLYDTQMTVQALGLFVIVSTYKNSIFQCLITAGRYIFAFKWLKFSTSVRMEFHLRITDFSLHDVQDKYIH